MQEKYIEAIRQLARLVPDITDIDDDAYEAVAELLYICDSLIPVADLETLVETSNMAGIQSMLKYSLAERLLAAGDYLRAKTQFEQVGRQYGDLVIKHHSSGQAVKLSEMVDFKLRFIEVLSAIPPRSEIEGKLQLARLLDIYGPASPFENELKSFLVEWERKSLRPVSTEYMQSRVSTYIAADLRLDFVRARPDDPVAPQEVLLAAKSLHRISTWATGPTSDSNPDLLQTIRDRIRDALALYLDHYQGQPQVADLDDLIELGYPIENCVLPNCSEQQVVRMREWFLLLAQRLPNDHRANNLLNWVAWSYCLQAVRTTRIAEFTKHYSAALDIYRTIVRQYPTGLTAQNARIRVGIIERKLMDPTKYFGSGELSPQWDWW